MDTQRFHIDGPVLFTPKRFEDGRGYFSEVFRHDRFVNAIGEGVTFVQDNQSLSKEAGTLRGLHYQAPPRAQGKLVRVLQGEVFDVAVDARVGSPTFGQHIGVTLSSQSLSQFWVPPGFLHGFVTRRPDTIVAYKVTDYYAPDCDGAVRWDSLEIDWGLPKGTTPILSDKDKAPPAFADWASLFV